jgi:hypothetical protein|uniref:Uncharacterized protein n=1 Tax=Podoviridae sp. ctn7K25 TaxID=2825273 RepID=A0A8S5QCA3_9CAUD|nr:MAG TPA: hypothetical protein [Podoviridae sp. ctn7K25]
MVTIVAVCMVMLSMLGTSLASHSQLPTTPQFFKNLNKTYKIMSTTALFLISFSSSATSMPHANARRNCAASARKPSVSVVKQHAPSILPMLRTT